MYEENEYTLTRYYASSPDSLIGRVAPCLRAIQAAGRRDGREREN